MESIQLSPGLGVQYYTQTSEPRPMCLAAIHRAGIKKCYFIAARQCAAHYGFDDNLLYEELIKPVSKRKMMIMQEINLYNEVKHLFECWKEKGCLYVKDLSIEPKGFIMTIFKKRIALSLIFMASTLHAAMLTTEIYTAQGTSLGQVIFEDSKYGLLIKPQLSGLPVGLHGFHIHQHPDCGDNGMHAGGHFDPDGTNSHQGPYGAGHLGDLPVLATNSNGEATTALLAPRLTTEKIRGHALMVHAGGDNYSDTPPLGGGGLRIGCGKIAL